MKKLQLVLWTAVLLLVGVMVATRLLKQKDPVEHPDRTASDGRVFVEIPWEHLPDVADYQLTERSGRKFSSSELAGKPYALNIFFASCPTICYDFNKTIRGLSRQVSQNQRLDVCQYHMRPSKRYSSSSH